MPRSPIGCRVPASMRQIAWSACAVFCLLLLDAPGALAVGQAAGVGPDRVAARPHRDAVILAQSMMQQQQMMRQQQMMQQQMRQQQMRQQQQQQMRQQQMRQQQMRQQQMRQQQMRQQQMRQQQMRQQQMRQARANQVRMQQRRVQQQRLQRDRAIKQQEQKRLSQQRTKAARDLANNQRRIIANKRLEQLRRKAFEKRTREDRKRRQENARKNERTNVLGLAALRRFRAANPGLARRPATASGSRLPPGGGSRPPAGKAGSGPPPKGPGITKKFNNASGASTTGKFNNASGAGNRGRDKWHTPPPKSASGGGSGNGATPPRKPLSLAKTKQQDDFRASGAKSAQRLKEFRENAAAITKQRPPPVKPTQPVHDRHHQPRGPTRDAVNKAVGDAHQKAFAAQERYKQNLIRAQNAQKSLGRKPSSQSFNEKLQQDKTKAFEGDRSNQPSGSDSALGREFKRAVGQPIQK